MTTFLLAMVAFMPEANLDLYISEPIPAIECSHDMLDYPTKLLPFEEAKTIHLADSPVKTLDLKPGYLVSECQLLKMTNAKIELTRLKLDLETIRELRSREFELWRLMALEYQEQIDQFTKNSWWRRNKLLVGVLSGIAGTIAITVVTYSLTQ